MKVEHIPEPELQFSAGQHIDVRFGLMNYGPFDREQPSPARTIRIGIVGNGESIEGILKWLTKCKAGIAAKASRQPNLFPRFPGYGDTSSLACSLVLEANSQRVIKNQDIAQLSQIGDHDRMVEEAVALVMAEVRYLASETTADVIICALPRQMLDLLEKVSSPILEGDDEGSATEPPSPVRARAISRLNLRSLLKARAMQYGRPIQIVLPSTWGGKGGQKRRRRDGAFRPLQDEATRAWNFLVALYYKRGGIPWRLVRDSAALDACYIGIGFFKTLDELQLHTSVAQVFDERGDGFVVRGANATLGRDDLVPHLGEADSKTILIEALKRYRESHRNFPARIVVHKSSRFSAEERAGCLAAAQELRIDQVDLLALRRSPARLFRMGAYPPLRGTFMSLDDRFHVLYTRGSVEFFATYPGMYVPLPLEIEVEAAEHTPRQLAEEILALTKMNWNSTQFDHSEPITLVAASRVGSILKHLAPTDRMQPKYCYYM